jgi:hypothetical protein
MPMIPIPAKSGFETTSNQQKKLADKHIRQLVEMIKYTDTLSPPSKIFRSAAGRLICL